MKLSPWMPLPGSSIAFIRVEAGSDPSQVKNHYSFVENAGRVRIAPFTPKSLWVHDSDNWKVVSPWHKHPGYGGYEPAKRACDEALLAMGYELED